MFGKVTIMLGITFLVYVKLVSWLPHESFALDN